MNLNFKKILIIKPLGIGDVLFVTPLVKNIKEAAPGIFLEFICNERTKAILANNPYIDRILVYEKDYYRDLAKQSRIKCLKEFLSFLKQIKKERFDLAIDLSLSGQVSFLLWLIGIKRRAGFNYKNRSWLLTDKITIDGFSGKHMVEFHNELLRSLQFDIRPFNMEIFLTPDEKKWAEDFLKGNGISGQDLLIAIIPGGGASWGRGAAIKHWPAEKFGEIADKCIEKFKAKIIILGDYVDVDACNRVYKALGGRAIQACGKTDLRQFAALLSRCSMAVTNDGGPLHVAVAAGTKTVSLFGPVDEKVYGPFPYDPRRHRVVKKELPCRPCYRRFRMADCDKRICLEEIDAGEVLKAIEELI